MESEPGTDPPKAQSSGLPGAGTVLGRYFILHAVGAGAMGAVVSAYDSKLDRRIALKFLRPDRVNATTRARFVTEAQAMARIAHPNVIPVYDSGVEGELAYLSMELVDGQTLSQWLTAEKRSWKDILTLFLQAGRGLAAAHAAGLVHRDFKPDNVLVGKDGRVRVTDFGVARALDDESAARPRPLAPEEVAPKGLTASNLLGTPAYMAPEQLDGMPLDGRADQYGFCACLWEAWYGQLPYPGRSLPGIWNSMQSGGPQSPGAVKIPKRVRQAVVRGLSTKPEERFPSMEALLAELEAGIPKRLVQSPLAGLALVAAASAALLLWPRNQECGGLEEPVLSAWNGAVRDTMERAFRATEAPYASLAFQQVSAAFDDWRDKWVAAREAACRATRMAKTQSEATLEARMACLDIRLQNFAALAAQLVRADKATIKRVQDIAARLESPDICTTSSQEPFAVLAAMSAERRAEMRILYGRIAAAQAQFEAGHLGKALKSAEALDSDESVKTSRKAALDLALLEGKVLTEMERNEQAAAKFRFAMNEALATRDWPVASEAVTKLIPVLTGLERYQEAEGLCKTAYAMLEASNAEPTARLEIMVSESKLAHALERREQGEKLLATAIQEAKRLGYDTGPTFERMLQADLLFKFDRGLHLQAEAVAKELLDRRTARLGADHTSVADTNYDLCRAQSAANHFTEAEASCRTALKVYRRDSAGTSLPRTLIILGSILRQLDRHNEALEALNEAIALEESKQGGDSLSSLGAAYNNRAIVYAEHLHDIARGLVDLRRALELDERKYGPRHTSLTIKLMNIAELESKNGSCGEALSLLSRAQSIYEENPGYSYARPVAFMGEGECQLALGNRRAAQGSFERALALSKEGEDFALRGEARVALAKALAGSGSGARRRQLLADARKDFERCGEACAQLLKALDASVSHVLHSRK